MTLRCVNRNEIVKKSNVVGDYGAKEAINTCKLSKILLCHPEFISGSYYRNITTTPENIKSIPSTSHAAQRHVRGDFVPRKAAFTLAEVLITLGIIGVVAAMTLPTLFANYRKKQTVTQLKKAYSEINQAIKLSETENGELSGWHFEDTPASRDEFANDYFMKYFRIIKKCKPSNEECFSKISNINGAPITYINNPQEGMTSFITASGYSVLFWTHGTGNGGWIYIDIDGPEKGDGKLGKDIFIFQMQFDDNYTISGSAVQGVEKIGIFPAGLGVKYPPTRDSLKSGTGNLPQGLNIMGCSKESSGSHAGGLCGALIMIDGWEIKDDYPW